jgi:hypothetical protein
MQLSAGHNSIIFTATLVASLGLVILGVAGHVLARGNESPAPLVVRVALFPVDQDQPSKYEDFVRGHLFPTLRTVPGYVGTFLGRDTATGALISLSFWRSAAAAAAGEEAVGRAIRALPPGTAPKPSHVEKYVVEYRDLAEAFSK